MPHKYGAKRMVVDGITFPSQKEGNRYIELKFWQMAGEISDLTVQPEFELQAKFTDQTGKKHQPIIYKSDFSYLEKGDSLYTIEEVKGMKTPVFKIKWKLVLKQYGLSYNFIIT